MNIKILTGKHNKRQLDVYISLSEIASEKVQLRADKFKLNYGQGRTASDEYYLNRFTGAYGISGVIPIIEFGYMGTHGEKNFIILQLLLQEKIIINEAKILLTFLWRIYHRVLNDWNTTRWQNIKGLHGGNLNESKL